MGFYVTSSHSCRHREVGLCPRRRGPCVVVSSAPPPPIVLSFGLKENVGRKYSILINSQDLR